MSRRPSLHALAFAASVPCLAIAAPAWAAPAAGGLDVLGQLAGAVLPIVLPALGGLVVGAAGTALAALLAHDAKAKAIAQAAADVAAYVHLDELVTVAESTSMPGPAKFAQVYRLAKQQLAAAGVTGRAATVTEKYLPDLINAAVGRLFPPKAPAAA